MVDKYATIATELLLTNSTYSVIRVYTLTLISDLPKEWSASTPYLLPSKCSTVNLNLVNIVYIVFNF